MRPMSQVETTDTPDNLLKVYAHFRACLSATLLIMYLIDMGLNVLGNTFNPKFTWELHLPTWQSAFLP